MFFFKKKERAGPVDWIVAGLGNPGLKYERTRHNAGFIAADMLASKLNAKIDRLKFQGLYARAQAEFGQVLLLKPQTFMNLSGRSIRDACDYFKVDASRVLVIYDDVSLPPGRIRIRGKGSDGGHNGIKSIIYSLESDVFPRIKIGVGSPSHSDFEMKDWVTSEFSDQDVKLVAQALERSVDAAVTIMVSGVEAAANKFNSQ